MRENNAWYKEYHQAVVTCEACSARKECRQPVPGEGNANRPGIVFIGRNPGKDEDREGRPFVGKAGEVLYQALHEVFGTFKPSSFFITNLVLCHTKENRLLSRMEVITCTRRFLIPTLRCLKPKVVVVFGQQPNYFINRISQIRKYTGTVLQHKMGFFVVPSVHPAAICYGKINYEVLRTAIEVAKKVLDGG